LEPSTARVLHQLEGKKVNGDQEDSCRLYLIRLLTRVDDSAGKGLSGMDEFCSVIDRMNMKPEAGFLTLRESRPSSLKVSSV